jgi:hypothetical protein
VRYSHQDKACQVNTSASIPKTHELAVQEVEFSRDKETERKIWGSKKRSRNGFIASVTDSQTHSVADTHTTYSQ